VYVCHIVPSLIRIGQVVWSCYVRKDRWTRRPNKWLSVSPRKALQYYEDDYDEDDCLLGCNAVYLINVDRRFRGALLPPLSGRWSTCEMSVNFYETTRRKNPEDVHLHTRRLRTSNLLQLFTVTQLAKKFPDIMEPEDSSPCSQNLVTGHYPGIVKSGPPPHV
jgi:hypothetical protein